MFPASQLDSRLPGRLSKQFDRWLFHGTMTALCWLTAALPVQAETYFFGFGANQYPHLPKQSALPYCSQDVRQFAETLKSRCGVVSERSMLLFVEEEGREQREPTARNIREQLPIFLRKLTEDDTVILFGSCHGSRDPQTGRGYLQLADAEPENAIPSSLDLVWLRDQLLQCKPRNVVVFLDACHSGSIGTPTDRSASRLTKKDFEVVFSSRQTPSPMSDKFLCTLVSCSASEKSVLWLPEKQSLFTFWLCRGLEGAADANGNGAVSLDELFEFTERQVSKTAKYLARTAGDDFQQTPARFFLGSNHGNKELFPIQPDGLQASLKRVAMLLESLLTNHARETNGRSTPLQVALLPITGQHLGEPDLSLSSTLGSVARENLERALISHATSPKAEIAFAVVSKSAVQPFLDLKDFRLQEVGGSRFAELAQPDRQPRVDVVIVGSYLRTGIAGSPENRDRLLFEFRLIDVRSGQFVGRVSTSIVIDEEFRALLPESFDSQRPLPAPRVASNRIEPVLPRTMDYPIRFFQIAKNERGDRTSHPIEFLVAESQAKQQPVFAVNRGDVLEIDIANPTEQWVAMLIYVDGLSVLGKQPVAPTEARPWLFPPETSLRLKGWHEDQSHIVLTNGGAERQRIGGSEFLVTAPPESVAGRQKLGKEIGQIQIVVYPTKSLPPNGRSVGIGKGAKLVNDYQVHRHLDADRSRRLAQYVFHYVAATELQPK